MQLFAFDFETKLIQPYLMAPPIVCMSSCIDDQEPELFHTLDSRLLALLHQALTTPGCMMVAHNLAFEVACILAAKPEWTELVFAKLDAGEMYCTYTAEKLISIGMGDHAKEFGLDDCLRRHEQTRQLAELIDKSCWWRLRYGLLSTTPCQLWTEEADTYARMDAVAARELYRAQLANGRKYLHDNTARWTTTPRGGHKVWLPGQTWYSVSLYLTSCVGFPTDPEMAELLWEETLEKLKRHESELRRVGFLVPVTSKGVQKYQLKKAPAVKLLTACYQAQGREPPRGGVTPSMLVKAYANAGMDVEYHSKKARGDKFVPDSDIEEAIQNGCSPKDLLGNVKLDEEACLGAGHPLLTAYTFYAQATTLKKKIARLKKPLIQTSYNPIVETGRTSSRQGDDPNPGEPWTAYGMQVQNLPQTGDTVEGT